MSLVIWSVLSIAAVNIVCVVFNALDDRIQTEERCA